MYIEAKPLIWLNLRDLWLDRTISPKYARKVFSIRYGMGSYKYNKFGWVQYEFVKEVKRSE